MKKILIIGSIHNHGIDLLKGNKKFEFEVVDNTDTEFLKDKIKDCDGISIRTSKLSKEINVYSFALRPEEHQPSGTCNFSKIDKAHLRISGSSDGGGTIYAVNYNILKITSGMGGLAFSN